MGWGSSTRRGGGQKVRALPRKFVFLGCRREGCTGNFAVMSWTPGGVQKVCAKQVCAHFPFPEMRHVATRLLIDTKSWSICTSDDVKLLMTTSKR